MILDEGEGTSFPPSPLPLSQLTGQGRLVSLQVYREGIATHIPDVMTKLHVSWLYSSYAGFLIYKIIPLPLVVDKICPYILSFPHFWLIRALYYVSFRSSISPLFYLMYDILE